MDYTTRTSCRVCGSEMLTPLFSIGEQYVSNFVDRDKIHAGPKCPIDVEMCRTCLLVQLKHTAPQDLLYTRHYWYVSGRNQTMRDALRDVTAAAESMVDLQPGDVVLDIGSNDGTLLRSYGVNPTWPSDGLIRVGVEPATNLAEDGRRGLDVFIGDFWDYETYQKAMVMKFGLPNRLAKVVTACGMFYDLDDPNAFIADVAKVLAPDGLFIAQLMCLKQTVESNDVGNFCHEHLEYYSLRSLIRLFENHGLQLFHLEENKVNGGSYRLFIRHKEVNKLKWPNRGNVSDRFLYALEKEQQMGLDKPEFYQSYFARIEENKRKVASFIQDRVAAGKKVWVYGASTKGNTILQYYSLNAISQCEHVSDDGGPCLIEAAADRSPEKSGKYTVGTGIPIVSEEAFRKANPDYALVLPYAFLPEFIRRESEWLHRGGTFIVPLPEFRLVSSHSRWNHEEQP